MESELDVTACEAHCRERPMPTACKLPRVSFVGEPPLTATGNRVHYQVPGHARRDAASGLLTLL